MRSKIGHYEIAQELGRGGMGVVYKGFEASLNRFVAIKTLSESLAHDPSIVERFMREARSMASLNDPHIIQIYFVGEDQGQPFFAMEFVEGESLSQKLKREGRISASVACQILLQTAQGLTTAHDRGVIHRDIKPANLMITTRGLVKVADFGIALATQDFSKKLTSTGEFVGTPGYLSPEVCMGKTIDPRSDIFSLGIVFFEMLTGRIPFNDVSPLGLMLEVVQAEIPDVRTLNSEVDANVHAILSRMVAKEPHHRYQDCHQLIEDLVAIGTSTVGGLNARPLSAQIVIPPPAVLPSGRQSLPSGAAVPPPLSAPPPRVSLAPSASTVVSSPNNSGPPPMAAAAAAARPPSQVRPAPPPVRKSSALPWAIAATLLLAGSGFAGWQYRDKLGFGSTTASTMTPATAAPTPATPTPSAPTPVASTTDQPVAASVPPPPAPMADTRSADPAQPVVVAESPSSTPNTPAGAALAEVPTVAGTSPTGTTSGAPNTATTPTAGTTPDMSTTLAEMQAATKQLEQARQEMEKLKAEQLASTQNTPANVPALTGPGPRAGFGPKRNLERLGERVNARTQPPTQMAQASPMAASSAPGGRILVVGFGHPGAAAAAEAMLSDELSSAGFTVISADAVSGVSRMQGGAPDLPAIARLAAANRIDVIVAANVQVTGTQELQYYGQSSTMITSLMGVKAYAVGSRVMVGTWSESLSFTALNVLDNTREAVQPHVQELTRKLAPYRARG